MPLHLHALKGPIKQESLLPLPPVGSEAIQQGSGDTTMNQTEK